jgi:rhomboid protease GluP
MLYRRPYAGVIERGPLILTCGLLGALLAVFGAEYVLRISPQSGALDASIETLIALGALEKPLVESGEWWRLFSAPLLHAGVLHLALNGMALFFAGAVLENVIGRAWFAAIFAVSGISGAFMSLMLNPPGLISVGASGAIMGLFAAALAVSCRYPARSRMRTLLRSGALCLLVPSMLPIFDGLWGLKADYAAHLGGAIGGLALGLALIGIWRRAAPLPPYRAAAWALAALGLCGVLYSGVQIGMAYPAADIESQLIPAAQAHEDPAAWKANSEALIALYPRDPRSHMSRALALTDKGDNGGAEREWRTALSEPKILHLYFSPSFEDYLRANLATLLMENGKESEARDVVRPVCAAKGETAARLAKGGLCP